MNIRNTIAAINQMQADGIVERYGIGGAVGATFDFAKVRQSKRDFRQRLAAQPIEEKLALLDALRERALALRPASSGRGAGALQEPPTAGRLPGRPTA